MCSSSGREPGECSLLKRDARGYTRTPSLPKGFSFAIRTARPARAAPEETRTDPGAGARSVSPGISLDGYTGRTGGEIQSHPCRGVGSGQEGGAGCRAHRVLPAHGEGGLCAPARGREAHTDLCKKTYCRLTAVPTVSSAGPGRFDWRARALVSNQDQ